MAVLKIKQVDTWVNAAQPTYKSVPNLPKGLNEFIVTIVPWFSLVVGIILIIFSGLLGILSLLTSPFLGINGPLFLVKMLIIAVIAIIQGVLMIMAFPTTKAKSLSGWRLLTYITLLGLLSAIITLHVGNIVWGIIWTIIEFYFLFQIKSYYK